jgi:flavin reductase (DIM6/NTAB) family NADH-FMN oxidoreductase RutF
MKTLKTQFKKFQYFYPYTVALVGAGTEQQVNYMSCAWHTALSVEPPLFGVLISQSRFTHTLITEAKEFTVNFLSFDRVKLSALMGRKSGREINKIKEFAVKLQPARVIKSPVLEEAYVAFECRLAEIRAYGDHDLFVGEVLAVHEDPGVFTADGLLNPAAIRPLLYLGSDFYITVDPATLKHVVPD